MENEVGKNVDVKMPESEKNGHDKMNKSCSCSQTNKLVIILACVALVFGATGLVFGILGYEKSSTPITFLNNGSDGNSANFVEGSIADIADKVSKSVVSIVTSTTTKNFFGRISFCHDR